MANTGKIISAIVTNEGIEYIAEREHYSSLLQECNNQRHTYLGR